MDKKLYLLAELDNDTQTKIKEYEDIITENGLVGSQTKDIPYHITLCSFPAEREQFLLTLLDDIEGQFSEIEIAFSGLGLFGLRVLFLNPTMSKELIELYLFAKENSHDKNDDLAAHVTLLMDEKENITGILPKIAEKFSTFTGKIMYVSLCEFFPKRFIKRVELKG